MSEQDMDMIEVNLTLPRAILTPWMKKQLRREKQGLPWQPFNDDVRDRVLNSFLWDHQRDLKREAGSK